MPLPPKAIEELKAIYKKEHGKELPEEEAWAMAHRLITVFDILTRPPGSPGPTSAE